MSKHKKHLLSNKHALQKTEDELAKILIDYFVAINRRSPSKNEEKGLKDAIDWIKGKGNMSLNWSKVEEAIADGTWDPCEGPRSIYSSG
jgi:hypothetical protein